MSKIILTGTPGSGKTTIVSMLRNIKVVSLGTALLSSMKEKLDRDKIRSTLTSQQIKELRQKALKEIDRMPEDIIIDTHTSVKAGNKYIAGFSNEDIMMLHGIKAIIYLDAPAVDILLRRIGDKTRHREDETAEEIDEHRNINMSLATFYAQELGVPLYIIKNRQNRLEEARKEVEQAVKDALLEK